MQDIDSIELSLFSSRIEAICDEMGAQLRRSAFSPNIRDRLDFSCAVFDAQGELCAQAAHIPVHLGSMAYAMRDLVTRFDWQEGDQLILNDPFLGGTHLPDVTLVAPVFVGAVLCGFVANRAHYADIGAIAPGSMPLSRSLDEEGVLIPPQKICSGGELQQVLIESIIKATRNSTDAQGDLQAQMGCNLRGMQRLAGLIETLGVDGYRDSVVALNDYAERLARVALTKLAPGVYRFADVMDDDGQGAEALPLEVSIRVNTDGVHRERIEVDFSGTAQQTPGNINCPLSVTVAAVWYAFRCLMPTQTPACVGCFRPIDLHVPEGALLNAQRPAAVAAGNVETSSRVVDVVLGALAQALPDEIPAASQGTMNNIAFGASDDKPWGYYETIGGGMGAGSRQPGLSAVQSHMTNTRNTPVEVLELRFPLRVLRYAIRKNSGGKGVHRGGDGIVREFEFTRPAMCTLITERRKQAPWGALNGGDGEKGMNKLNNAPIPPKCELVLEAGDRITIETPGGGGWG
ncbi:MAG: hydantoinase B/oxoprolinase family protein [Thiothrix sp.]|nr:MAG: hydantoinase B/oxoprolinase family protein [Thiothrix sp.]